MYNILSFCGDAVSRHRCCPDQPTIAARARPLSGPRPTDRCAAVRAGAGRTAAAPLSGSGPVAAAAGPIAAPGGRLQPLVVGWVRSYHWGLGLESYENVFFYFCHQLDLNFIILFSTFYMDSTK